MTGESWASYQSALPLEARGCGERDDDEPTPGRHDHEPPSAVLVEWFQPVTFREIEMHSDGQGGFIEVDTGIDTTMEAPVHRWFPAERWAWKHAEAWRAAMVKRHGHATIEELF